MDLTRLDQGAIARLMQNAGQSGTFPPFSVDQFLAAQDDSWRDLKRSRERDECRAKLERLGIVAGS